MASPPPPPPGQGPPPGAMPMMFPPGMMGRGQPPTPEQIEALKAKIAQDAERAGMSVPEFVEQIKQAQARMMAARQQQMAAAQQQQQQGGAGPPQQGGPRPPGATPIKPGPPKPEALAVATFLQGQDLKPRTSIFNGERKQMFRVKRALRALESPAYAAARKKNPLLPEITDRASLENTFKLLPLSMLALRVSKADPHAGHNHGPGGHQGKQPKRVKGLWTVRLEQQQDADDDMYYVWLWEGSQLRAKLYAGLALLAIFALVLYPLWPARLRQGVYYLAWGMLGLLGLFFAMAIFRIILFCVTYFVAAPGLWLFPNLWEDVSFVESFKPLWGWHETVKPKKKKRSKSITAGTAAAQSVLGAATGQPAPATATTTATDTTIATAVPEKRNNYAAPQVEEVEE
jgi:translocation protein SEC62